MNGNMLVGAPVWRRLMIGGFAATVVLCCEALAQGDEPTPADEPDQSAVEAAAEIESAPAGSPIAQQPAEPTLAESAAPNFTPADPELLARLVRELDDDRYGVRESAQKQLAALGGGAVGAVAEAAAKGSLESSTRAVNVLLGWADSHDRQLSLAALQKLASLENRPTEAAMADERLAEVRELAAVDAIRKLGGRFDYDRIYSLGGAQRAVQVVLGPQWKGGAEGLRHLKDVRSATTLSLWSTPVDDAAVDHLSQLDQLKRIEFYGCESMSRAAMDRVNEKLPQVQVDIRPGGARLGVAGINCQQVLPDSAAEKAGLKEGDRIVAFAGEEIDQLAAQQIQFEQLTKLIAKCKPGDTKPITVERMNPQTGAVEKIELSVTFDRWGDDVRPSSGLGGAQDPFGAPRPAPQQVMQGRIIIQGQGGVQRIQVLPQVQPVPANNRR